VVDIVDGSTCLWNHLKLHTDLTAFRAMIVSGADGVYEAGDLTAKILSREVEQRRDDDTPANPTGTMILAVSVQDAAERPSRRHESISEQTVRIRLLDRDKGYRNIRTARVELMEQLKPNNFRANMELGHSIGILTITWIGRTGHMRDAALSLDFEVITYNLTVVRKEN